jgi:hypothetical protein
MQKAWAAMACALVVSGCAVMRAKEANQAQATMVTKIFQRWNDDLFDILGWCHSARPLYSAHRSVLMALSSASVAY